MIQELLISNNNIYIEGNPISCVIKEITNYEIINNTRIYTFYNVIFCDISGILTVYQTDDNNLKLLFTSFNAVSIYEITKIELDYVSTIDHLKNSLAHKYRKLSDLKYFNRKYNLALTYNANNLSVLITTREELFNHNIKHAETLIK